MLQCRHCHPKIVEAIQKQAETLDYATAFQLGHPTIFAMAEKLVDMAPKELTHAFFTNSGSEAVDTALKIALAYHRARGEGHRTRLIGEKRDIMVLVLAGFQSGMSPNRKMFGAMLPGVDHLKHTHNLEHNAYSVGQPKWGDHLADQLTEILMLHDPSTVAAVIMEPIAGSAGVYLPPVGYLIESEKYVMSMEFYSSLIKVITGFGRTGSNFGSDAFGVTPDIMTIAKGMTSGTVPMGGVLVKEEIYDTFMTGPEDAIEFFHGYTYSGHPLAAAAGLATLKVYEEKGAF
ncbi:MAG: hypothetical protein Ct9H90mP13_08130 [Pseudomonadota bacterium]|nr:MAG: hypothetical protein Ct9H90mP13_08130 [Pseudomonadota bacterium]